MDHCQSPQSVRHDQHGKRVMTPGSGEKGSNQKGYTGHYFLVFCFVSFCNFFKPRGGNHTFIIFIICSFSTCQKDLIIRKNTPARGGLYLPDPPSSSQKKKKNLTYVKVSRVHCYWWHEMGKEPGEKESGFQGKTLFAVCYLKTRHVLKADVG